MIQRDWCPEKVKLEDAFFPVELCDLKFVYPAELDLFGQVVRNKDIPVKGHKAVVAVDNLHVFATVTDNYQLVTNRMAYDWSEPVMSTVFRKSHLSDFTCFNVRMTSTRSGCCIDLIRKLEGGNFISFAPFGKDDPWAAFIRITNSYNKTSCLRYQLGFCRWICQNGMIFNAKSVTRVFPHTKDAISNEKLRQELSEAAEAQIGEIRSLENEFVEKLRKLCQHVVPTGCMMALACKIFDQRLTREKLEKMSEQQRNAARDFARTISSLTKEYCGEFGANAYAAMNILTDFATYPKGMNARGDISRFQAKAGDWVDDFIEASSQPDFNMTNYLGSEAVESAIWFNSLVAA